MKRNSAAFLRKAGCRIAKMSLVGILSCLLAVTAAAAEPELLDPAQAFQVTARWHNAKTIELNYAIADGYYMYRDRFGFVVDGKPVKLSKSQFPAGKMKQDATFGKVTTYRKSLRLLIPVGFSDKDRSPSPDAMIAVQMTSQGCADAGVCYPPLRQTLRLARGSSVIVGPEGEVATTGFSQAPNSGGLGDLLKHGK